MYQKILNTLLHNVKSNKSLIFLGTMHLKSLSEPGFVRETLKNVTVPEGRDVLLSCTVKNLDGHKVRQTKA